jgi:hypothetical protein
LIDGLEHMAPRAKELLKLKAILRYCEKKLFDSVAWNLERLVTFLQVCLEPLNEWKKSPGLELGQGFKHSGVGRPRLVVSQERSALDVPA